MTAATVIVMASVRNDPDADGIDADRRAHRLSHSIRTGDRGAVEELFHDQAEAVGQAVRRAIPRRPDLHLDASQDAWIRIVTNMPLLHSRRSLDSWIRRVSASAAIDLLRSELSRRSREWSVAATVEDARCFLDDVEAYESATQALRALSMHDAPASALLELRQRSGATLQQLAGALGLGERALESQIRRASERARAFLTNKEVPR